MKKLMSLTIVFGFLIIAANSASAQKLCSKPSDGAAVALDVRNETNNDIIVNSVDEKCSVDLFSGTRIGKGETLQISSYKDAVFRVEEAGKARFLVEFAVDPSKPFVIVKTASDGSSPAFVSSARESEVAANTQTANGQNTESAPPVLFKEDDKQNCSSAAPGKKMEIKWKNASKDYAMGFILINSDCEARGGFQRIGAGTTFTGTAYEGQVFYVIEHIDSDENYKSYIKIEKSTAIKTFGK